MGKMLNKGFEVLIASLPDYDSVVAELYFDGHFLALISQEEAGNFVLETPGCDLSEDQVLRKFDWRGFRDTVDEACNRLKSKA